MTPRTLALSCALIVVGILAAVAAAAGPAASREELVIYDMHDGLLLKLSKHRGVAVLIVDGRRLAERRREPYTFFVSDAMLRKTGLRHRIVIRDGKSGKLVALRYVRRHFPADCSVEPARTTAPGCTLLREDTAARADPEAGLWGNIEAMDNSRHQFVTSGGDPRLKADGTPQANTAFRRLTVSDGDDFFGERCELGRNTYLAGENAGSRTTGTFALYREGERKITFFSQRYGPGFTSSASGWQTIMQVKQTQPYGGNGPVDGAPAIEAQIFGNRLRLRNFDATRWHTPAPPKRVWIRYALDVTYSQDPARGKIQMFVDSNADGDFVDTGEASPVLTMRTLAYVTSRGIGAIPVGGSIPGHLRLGIYHDGAVYGTTTVDVDNVQVVGG